MAEERDCWKLGMAVAGLAVSGRRCWQLKLKSRSEKSTSKSEDSFMWLFTPGLCVEELGRNDPAAQRLSIIRKRTFRLEVVCWGSAETFATEEPADLTSFCSGQRLSLTCCIYLTSK